VDGEPFNVDKKTKIATQVFLILCKSNRAYFQVSTLAIGLPYCLDIRRPVVEREYSDKPVPLCGVADKEKSAQMHLDAVSV
jgi:hypothetical protein